MDLSMCTLFLHFAIMRLTVYSTFNVKHTVFSSTWVNVLSHFKPWKKQTLSGGQGQEHLLPRDTSVGTRCRDDHCCSGRSLVGPDGSLNYPVWGADLWIHFETIFTIWTLSVRQRSFSLQLPSRFTPTATSRSSRNVSARGFIFPPAIRHFVRAGVSISVFLFFFQTADISFWNEALHLGQALVIGRSEAVEERVRVG